MPEKEPLEDILKGKEESRALRNNKSADKESQKQIDFLQKQLSKYRDIDKKSKQDKEKILFLEKKIKKFESERVSNKQPNKDESSINLAIEWYNKGVEAESLDQKINCYKKAIKLNNKDGDSHNNLGCAYLNKKQYRTAIKHFEKSISIKPDSKLAYLNLELARKLRTYSRNKILKIGAGILTGAVLLAGIGFGAYTRGPKIFKDLQEYSETVERDKINEIKNIRNNYYGYTNEIDEIIDKIKPTLKAQGFSMGGEKEYPEKKVESAHLSPDGKKLLIYAVKDTSNGFSYNKHHCFIVADSDGTNISQILDAGNGNNPDKIDTLSSISWLDNDSLVFRGRAWGEPYYTNEHIYLQLDIDPRTNIRIDLKEFKNKIND